MNIAEVEDYNGVIVIKLYGPLNLKVINEFDDICDNQIRRRPDVLALDCHMLDFIDSVGINHLFKLSHNAVSNNINLVFYNLNPTIQQIFQVTNLDKLLRIIEKETFESEYLLP